MKFSDKEDGAGWSVELPNLKAQHLRLHLPQDLRKNPAADAFLADVASIAEKFASMVNVKRHTPA